MSDLLDIRGLGISFGGAPAVRGIDLAIRAGETHALVGESGSGKSATALSILRLLPETAEVSGEIHFDGRDILKLGARDLRALRGNQIAMIFQEPMTSLNPVVTVGAQIAETLRRHRGLGRTAARAEAIRLLDLVRLPDPDRLVDRFPQGLSGGQRQRVMIAMAVACRPRLLIADEPTTALDVTIQSEILGLIDQLKRDIGMAVLLITHDLGLVAGHADRVSVANAGLIVESGPADRVLTAPAHPYTRGLLGASLGFDDPRHFRSERLVEIRRTAPATAAAFELVTPALGVQTVPYAPGAEPLLELRDLKVDYPDRKGGTVHAVDGVSLTLRPGETLGLVGESGCGKSTLSKAIMGLVPAASGQIRVGGTDILPLSGRDLTPHRRRLQLVFQDPYGSLNPRVSVAAMLDRVQRLSGTADATTRRAEARAIIDRVGLPAAALDRYPHEFSGGQRQRLVIARALVQRPEIVICDEPVSALDVSVQAQILNLLSELKEDFGLSYLFISHDLGVVRYIADRVAVMNRGRIVEEGAGEQVLRAPGHDYTRRLIAAMPGPQPRARLSA